MSEELKWPEPDSYAVMAFGTHQKLVVRADVAEEWASKYREQGFINVSVVPLFTYAQTCELIASICPQLELARGEVDFLKNELRKSKKLQFSGNKVEIKIGQKWETRAGWPVRVAEFDASSTNVYPWRIEPCDGAPAIAEDWLTALGNSSTDETYASDSDLMKLIEDVPHPHPTTQPSE